MHKDVLTVHKDMSLKDVAIFLTRHGISGAPVTDDEGTPIGLISASDLVAHAANLDEPKEDNRFLYDLWQDVEMPNLDLEFADWATAHDAMTDFLVHVDEETPILELIDLIGEVRLHRILVTRKGKLTGIVTTMDLVACLGRVLRHKQPEVLSAF